MKKKIVSILVCMLMFVAVSTVTGTSKMDINPNGISTEKSNVQNLAAWDLLAVHYIGATGETGANGNAGAEFDGTYHYSTRWASNLIHKYDIDGFLVDEFSISGVNGLRDLAWDGEYMYGGAASSTIWQMDFETQTLVDTITGGFASRAIAYDSDLDVFYCSDWGDPVWVVDRDGTVVDQFNLGTTTSTYGFAYDNQNPDGGPYLWVFDQTTGATATIYQWDLVAEEFTGFTYDVNADVGSGIGIAGGLWLAPDYQDGLMCIGGCVQDSSAPGVTDYLFVYELYITNAPPETPSAPSGPSEGVVTLDYDFTASTTDPDDDMVAYGWDYDGDFVVDEWTDFFDSGATCEVTYSWDDPGTYNIRVKAKDVNDLESDWSAPHQITIIETPDLSVISIDGALLKLKAELINNGPVDANGVSWSINLEGGLILLGGSSSGTIDIPAGQLAEISTGIIIGIGSTTVRVTLDHPLSSATKTKTVFVLGFLFL
jgi:hypothetical protein